MCIILFLFHEAQCFKAPYILLPYGHLTQRFSLLPITLWHGYSTFYLNILLLMDSQVASNIHHTDRTAVNTLDMPRSHSDLTIEGLNAVDVILMECVGAGFVESIVGIHQSTRVRGVRQPQWMAKFMGSNKKQVVIWKSSTHGEWLQVYPSVVEIWSQGM